ncbi:MAG: DEAD/DEAH box helicase, partial [Microvirga sp.]
VEAPAPNAPQSVEQERRARPERERERQQPRGEQRNDQRRPRRDDDNEPSVKGLGDHVPAFLMRPVTIKKS